jgi:hypothetical protein
MLPVVGGFHKGTSVCKSCKKEYNKQYYDKKKLNYSALPSKSSLNFEKLNMKQKEALLAVTDGQNVFITGGAGVGKSYLIDYLIQDMEINKKKCAVVAPTGVAAVQIKGFTIHSYFRLPIYCDQMTSHELQHPECSDTVYNRIRNLEILIIDEVSMIHQKVFEMIESISRTVRNSSKCFGGLQIVLIGDFFQLAPISQDEKKSFIFETNIWEKLNLHSILLTEPHRQNTADFEILSKIRKGNVSFHDLKSCFIEHMDIEDLVRHYSDWTILYATNKMKDNYNSFMNSSLDTPIHTFQAKKSGEVEKMFNHVPDCLELRIGSRVMIIHNINGCELINGDVGQVIGFKKCKEKDDELWPIVHINRTKRDYTIRYQMWKFYAFFNKENDAEKEWRVIASKYQLPLALGWSFTIHKVQGLTLDKVVVDLNNLFSPGQAYVALSRCRNLEQLKIINYHSSKIIISALASKFYEEEEACEYYKNFEKNNIDRQKDNTDE